MTATIAERVAAGAQFLDEQDPDWWRADVDQAIDLDRLDMGEGDACVLGQRCPLETLTAWLGGPPRDNYDYEYLFHAYAEKLTGLPSGGLNREALDAWAVAHGFNRASGTVDGGAAEYDALTAEWARVIRERRSA